MKKYLPLLIIALVGVAAVLGAVMYSQTKKTPSAVAQTNGKTSNSNAAAQTAAKSYAAASPGAQPAWSKGAATASVVLEEFADFQCGSCAAFSPTLREIKTVYGDRVRVIYRQYPLPMHNKAEDASRAAEAAGLQGKFWEMHDMIYDKQKDWSIMTDARAAFAGYAKTLGLDVDKFNNDMVGQIAAQRVAADKKRGNEVGVRATPSVFLNGRLLTPPEMTASGMREAVDQALQAKPAATSNVAAPAAAGNPATPSANGGEAPGSKKP